MSFETIRYDLAAGVATLTLDRPEVRNGLNAPMRRELVAAIARAGSEARALVLTGAGRAFCSGQDLAEARAMGAPDFGKVLREEYEPLLAALDDCPIPTLAAVNGAAAGAGANLALAADVVIAARSAIFVQAFSRIGLIPDAGGTWTLPRRIGMARAMGAALFAEPIPAETAAAWGMIWEAAPDEDFAAVVAARAAQLAAGPTLAYRLTRQALRAGAAQDLAAQLALEAALQDRAGRSRDHDEGVAAFLEKRAPRFEGR